MPQSLLAPFCLLLAVLVMVQFALIVGLNGRMARQTRSLRTFFSSSSGEDIEDLLRQTLEQSREAAARSLDAEASLAALSRQVESCLQHVGLVRYDAFGDVTGQQSFSLAMLDGCDSGAIITALFSRTNSRCYGKIIVHGQAQQSLTDEEQQALIQALEQKVGTGK